MVNNAPPEQIKSVCEEIQHLVNNWKPGEIAEKDIRGGSTILRRLLVHNELHKVWNTLIGNEKFTLTAREILVEDESKLKFHDLYTCSEVTHQGSTIYAARAYIGKTTMTPIGNGKFRDETNYGVRDREREFTLNEFMDSVCVIAEGKLISRNWVVQYVANSLGGAHFGAPKKKSERFIIAMKKLKKFDVGEMPASVREVLGIAQALCRSQSIDRLLAAYAAWEKENPKIRIA